MKPSRVVYALLLVSLLGSFVQAQTAGTRVTPCNAATPNNAFCVTGTHDGKDTNGNAITGVTFRVQQKTGSGSYTTVATALTSLQYYATNLTPGTTYTWRVYASCAACTSESNASNEAGGTATAPPVVPTAPIIIVAATIRADGPPSYRIVYTVRPRDGEVVFVAPESMRPVFAAR